MPRSFNALKYIDKYTIGLYFILVIFGLMNIYGASVNEHQTSIFQFGTRSGMQMVWFGVSLVVSLVIITLDSKYYNLLAYPLYVLSIITLFITAIVAPDIKGSHSWLPLGPFSIQPAEFSKFITSLALAKLFSKHTFSLSSLKEYAIVLAMIFVPMLIIIGQKETGSALVYFSFMVVLFRRGLPAIYPLLAIVAVVIFITVIKLSTNMMFDISGAPLGIFLSVIASTIIFISLVWYYSKEKWTQIILLSIFAGLYLMALGVHIFLLPLNFVYVSLVVAIVSILYVAVVAFIKWNKQYLLSIVFLLGVVIYSLSAGYIFDSVLQPHQQMRIKVLLGMENDPTGIGYNTNQAYIAIGSGGLIGKGYLQGTQTQLKYVPEQDTDFIFCTVGEEWGFLGSSIVLILYLIFLLRLLVLAERNEDRFVSVYGYCVVGIFAFHLMINIGMVLGLAPVIGIPLPFFSYGGSSLLSFTILLFIFLRLDASRYERLRSSGDF